MPDFDSIFVYYGPPVIALFGVLAYFLVIRFAVRSSDPRRASVVTYEPPSGISPALAAWLTEPGALVRALAAALVNMAAKRFLTIQETADGFSVTKNSDASFDCLEPEEDALAYALFQTYQCFEFDGETRPVDPLNRFKDALNNRTYFTSEMGLSIPAWIVSFVASLYALYEGIDFSRLNGEGLSFLILVTILLCGFYGAGLRTMGDAIAKMAGRMAGREPQQRPWTVNDSVPLILLSLAAAGVFSLARVTSWISVLILAAFLTINAVFYVLLHGPNAMGRKLLDQALAYREFLGAVEADPLTRSRSHEQVPADLSQKDAYAIAFHLDLGWGERFVTSITDLLRASQDEAESGGRQAYQVYRNL